MVWFRGFFWGVGRGGFQRFVRAEISGTLPPLTSAPVVPWRFAKPVSRESAAHRFSVTTMSA
jgi:hypothetical protein